MELFSPDKERAIDLFIKHMTRNNEDSFPAFDENIRFTDAQVIIKLKELGVENISELQKLEKNMRNSYIWALKITKGIGIRQISRITGISKGVIERAQ